VFSSKEDVVETTIIWHTLNKDTSKANWKQFNISIARGAMHQM
jgi:hypothetical protein